VRQAVAQVFASPAYQWRTREGGFAWLARQFVRLAEWFDRFHAHHPILYYVTFSLIVLLLLVIAAHIGYVVLRIVRPTPRTAAGPVARPGAPSSAAAHLARAAALARDGRFAEALGHRFLALVLELDRRKLLRFHASKTPAEYVGEARLTDTGRASLAGLVAQLYRHLFGALPCDEREYEAFDLAAREIAGGSYGVPA
jgi:hypothetical protein